MYLGCVGFACFVSANGKFDIFLRVAHMLFTRMYIEKIMNALVCRLHTPTTTLNAMKKFYPSH